MTMGTGSLRGRDLLRIQSGSIAVASAAALLVPLVLFSFAAWESYQSAVGAARERVEQSARLLEEHALNAFESQRLVIEAANARTRSFDWSNADARRELHLYLKRLEDELDQVATVTMTDDAGFLRASGRRFPADRSVGFADRDWYLALKGEQGALPYVSRSYIGRQSGEPVFNVASRGPANAIGGYDGYVAVSVDRGYFERFYKDLDRTYDHSVTLVRADGQILAAEPPTTNATLEIGSVFLADARRSPRGAYERRSPSDGVYHFFAYRKVGGYPVYVRYGITRSSALASWRTSLRTYGIVSGAAALLLAVAAGRSQRQTQRWRDAASALAVEAKERERVEAQLRQLQKMEAVGQLTGGIAHDFNNMLAVIIGGLNLVQRRLARGDADVGRYVEAAMDGATRAATLTQRLLAFSRQQPLQPEPLAVNDLVAGMSEMLRRTLGDEVRLETVLAGGLWKTKADAGQLENALLNLAVNARDAMPEGGRLTVETANAHLDEAYACDNDAKPGQYVLIAVTDTGTGMPPEVAARAFDPFFTTKGVGKGTGLGLSQTFGFVKQSAGHIKIYSESGHGTTFKVYLPRLFEEAAAAEMRRRPPLDLVHGRPEEIVLLVEDEDRVRLVSADALRELGYTVIHAGSGDEALALLRIHPDVTLLLTDVMMPGMNGRELAERVQAERPAMKVLFATGYTRNAIVHNGVLDPGVNLISKPFTLEQIATKIRSVLNG